MQFAAPVLAIAMTICPPTGYRTDCVVDGDTIWHGREKVRIENIDTPELRGRCPLERKLAKRAQLRLRALLHSGYRLTRTGTDRYGRTLARLSVNGRDVGAVLIAEGLARRWDGRRRSWCE